MPTEPKILVDFLTELKKYGIHKAATEAGISYSAITKWVTGEAVPTLSNAQKVADIMGLEFLLFDKE